ncbi:unnamed protein product [Spodoptera exigua]|uniref:Major facilitator superfamily (MFS) profile domain-containing protein n=1 Tax=Spodoptera exigua TaxID=7107 RepID=A0A835GNM5_SPOEX|nr:hypothetical protein HW555_003641 [Spodoptera exigua]KAH9630089.1 hypothetical protein HF086_004795 [Spodoptera exigua]CAH0683214.1 unnamed protein product [Spodoptera exigua]
MKQRVATDERPFKTGSTDETPSEEEPAAALVVPPDGGWGWVVMIASFCCNFMVDGVILSNGAILPAIRKEFNATEIEVAPINSLLAGFYLLLGPIASALANKYGFRTVTILGSVISAVGFATSYYATSPQYLYVSYGVIGGFGVCLIFMPAVLTVGFYFEKWRALATGIALCGSGVGVFVMSPITKSLVDTYGWRMTIFSQSGMMLLCILFGLTFKPIEPVHVVVEEEAATSEEEEAERNKLAAEKLKNMMKLENRLDSGIRMPHDMKFATKSSPHTWMGVSNNTRYPTAEEVFRGSSTVLNAQRRSSATAGTIKSNLGAKPAYATVSEKDEQEDSNSTPDKATQPLIGSVLRVMSHTDYSHQRRSTVDLVARPLYREDIFFGASLARLPQYTSRTSLGYHLAVTHVPSAEDEKEEKGRCQICPVAVRRALATLLDISLFKSVTFVILAISGFFTMTGFFVPFVYVQNRARENDVPAEAIEWLVSSIGVANIVGRLLCGLVSSMPKVSPLLVTNIALTMGGLATMLSNLCFDTYFQYGYCVIFGLSVACFAALRSIVVVEFLGLERLTNCFGLFLLFQGLGALIGSPIAGMLYDATKSYAISFYVSGAFILLSAVMCYPINRISKWEKKRAEENEKLKNTLPTSLVDKV